jgi:hypothetical protein
MRAWCPRCDAVRAGETSCPVCAAPLATLDDAGPGQPRTDLPPPPEPAPATEPPPPSRLRIGLALATLVVAGLAFVAGRSIARPAAPAPAAQATTTTTRPDPGADRRQLGWTAKAGELTITAIEASRLATERRETVATVTFRIRGLPANQRVLGLRGLRLLDAHGGVFASVEQRQFGREGGAPAEPVDGRTGTWMVVTGPAPRLSSLARIELAAVVTIQPRDRTIQLDTSGSWPDGPRMRAVDPGPRDAVLVDSSFVRLEGIQVRLQVTSAFVRDGLAVVAVDATSGFRGVPGDILPIGAELRDGDRVLCDRIMLLGDDFNQQFIQGIVLACPTRPVPRLTLALGAGAGLVPLDVTLRP